jgi:hypothetical protein
MVAIIVILMYLAVGIAVIILYVRLSSALVIVPGDIAVSQISWIIRSKKIEKLIAYSFIRIMYRLACNQILKCPILLLSWIPST